MALRVVPTLSVHDHEATLIRRVQSSDSQSHSRAYEKIERTFSAKLRACANRVHCDEFDRGDVEQRLRIALWRAIRNYDPKRGVTLATYVQRYLDFEVRHVIRERIKRKSETITFTEVGPQIEQIPDEALPIEAVISHEYLGKLVNSFVRSLSQTERRVLRHRFVFDQSSAETARSLNVSRAAVSHTERRVRVRGQKDLAILLEV